MPIYENELIFTCFFSSPVFFLRNRYFRDYTWTLKSSPEMNVTEQIVKCRCPKNSVSYLIRREPLQTGSLGYTYLFACSPQSVSTSITNKLLQIQRLILLASDWMHWSIFLNHNSFSSICSFCRDWSAREKSHASYLPYASVKNSLTRSTQIHCVNVHGIIDARGIIPTQV